MATVTTATERQPGHRTEAAATADLADVRVLDGRDDEMFPLRSAAHTAQILDCSPDHVHDLMASGRLPYVLLPPSQGTGSQLTEGRRRRVRADHLRQHVQSWTHR